ncbi:hypothetical protein KDK_60550 [Dictyobacter kobayashii]|uniref:Uncharacterized protein n=1 Tax=Dictyobacter kobayashii TaxID=2014872 RepID=A0A402AT47_9CHLR|nr:hypothetical protein KDK_60550 [Dictyobacter kobayashii]
MSGLALNLVTIGGHFFTNASQFCRFIEYSKNIAITFHEQNIEELLWRKQTITPTRIIYQTAEHYVRVW